MKAVNLITEYCDRFTPLIERLEDRLFGDDGEGGAIGTIRVELHAGFAQVNGRVSALETRNEVGKAVADERRIVKERIGAERRWRIGLGIGVASSVGLSLINLLFGR